MEKKEYEAQLFNRILRSFEHKRIKDNVSSLILTGSFGREEPIYYMGEEGLQLKSDIEIGVVFKDSTSKKTIEFLIRQVSSEFEEDLNLINISESRIKKAYNFNYSLNSPKRKTLFTYDLFNGSKTIWGNDLLKGHEIGLSSVDLYEAKRIVANRIGELVYLMQDLEHDDISYRIKQWKGKLMLAIVSAWLLCEGQYVSSYLGQRTCIEKNIEAVRELLGEKFIEDYYNVFFFLREGGASYEVSDKNIRGYVSCINQYFKRKDITSPKINSCSRMLKYYLKYSKTGIKYGIVGFEDNILQALINEFSIGSIEIKKTALVWYKVLY